MINASAQINGALHDVTPRISPPRSCQPSLYGEMLQVALPAMAERGWGRVVNIGSINHCDRKPIVSIYAATKAAQHT